MVAVCVISVTKMAVNSIITVAASLSQITQTNAKSYWGFNYNIPKQFVKSENFNMIYSLVSF